MPQDQNLQFRIKHTDDNRSMEIILTGSEFGEIHKILLDAVIIEEL